MGIGKTIWLILFCFILLLGAGLKGYGQDRKIVIDTFFFPKFASDYAYLQYKNCFCEEEGYIIIGMENGKEIRSVKGIINPKLVFVFRDYKGKIVGDSTIKSCSLNISPHVYEIYSSKKRLNFEVFSPPYWTKGSLKETDTTVHINLYLIENKYMDSLCNEKKIKKVFDKNFK